MGPLATLLVLDLASLAILEQQAIVPFALTSFCNWQSIAMTLFSQLQHYLEL